MPVQIGSAASVIPGAATSCSVGGGRARAARPPPGPTRSCLRAGLARDTGTDLFGVDRGELKVGWDPASLRIDKDERLSQRAVDCLEPFEFLIGVFEQRRAALN